MRKTLWITLSVFFVAIAVPTVHADSITDGTINFTVSSGSPAPTGSFVFDNTTNAFTAFTVDWDGLVFDFTGEANGLSAVTVSGCTSAGIFTYLVGNGCSTQITWQGVAPTSGGNALFDFLPSLPLFVATSGTGDAAIGRFAITTVATPEPSSVGLMLAGIGFLLVMLKRVA